MSGITLLPTLYCCMLMVGGGDGGAQGLDSDYGPDFDDVAQILTIATEHEQENKRVQLVCFS